MMTPNQQKYFEKRAIEHFDKVMNNLSMTSSGPMSLACTNSYVLIRFSHGEENWLFRYPIWHEHQQRRILLAYSHFENLGLLPVKLYDDQSCVIERYCENSFEAKEPDEDELLKLGQVIKKLHSFEGKGYGWLMYGRQGEYKKLEDFIRFTESDLARLEGLNCLSIDEFDTLTEATTIQKNFLSKPCTLSHGDLHFRNILYDRKQVKLTDWDRISSMPREFDFQNLYYVLNQKQWTFLMKGYEQEQDLDHDFISYFALVNCLRALALNEKESQDFDRALSRLKLVLKSLKTVV